MSPWSRETLWRQGHFLSAKAAVSAELVANANSAEEIPIVVSHDCDITQLPVAEPQIEVIVARRVAKLDGNFTFGKNARRLQLTAVINGETAALELLATGKRSISKHILAAFAPDPTAVLGVADRRILQLWLGARYSRSAFPDEFDRRLNAAGLTDRLAKILRPLGEHIVAVFFDVDEGQDIERQQLEDAYTLTIDLLYSTDVNPDAAESAAQVAAEATSALFKERCFDSATDRWQGIELVGCNYLSDEAMSYKQSRYLRRWNADYMSLKSEPPSEILSAGKS